jgi:hypothetical protein
VPAAAVIPAPLAYIKVVAVKKLVVECLAGSESVGALRESLAKVSPAPARPGNPLFRHLIECEASRSTRTQVRPVSDKFTLRKLECSAQAVWV